MPSMSTAFAHKLYDSESSGRNSSAFSLFREKRRKPRVWTNGYGNKTGALGRALRTGNQLNSVFRSCSGWFTALTTREICLTLPQRRHVDVFSVSECRVVAPQLLQ